MPSAQSPVLTGLLRSNIKGGFANIFINKLMARQKKNWLNKANPYQIFREETFGYKASSLHARRIVIWLSSSHQIFTPTKARYREIHYRKKSFSCGQLPLSIIDNKFIIHNTGALTPAPAVIDKVPSLETLSFSFYGRQLPRAANSHFLSQQSIIVFAMTTFPLSSYGNSSITERHLKAQGRGGKKEEQPFLVKEFQCHSGS